MSETILGYGDRIGYAYTHIKEVRQEPTTGFIHVGPLCRHGVKSYTYMPKDLKFVRQWHILYDSLAIAASRISEKSTYLPCTRCLAKANRIMCIREGSTDE